MFIINTYTIKTHTLYRGLNRLQMYVVGCLTVAAGILARSEGVSNGTGTDQRFVKNALKNTELPPDSFKYLFFFYFSRIHASYLQIRFYSASPFVR